MDKGLAYSFDYMLDDEVCSTVYVYTDSSVKVDNKTDVFIKKPFGFKENVTLSDVRYFFETRCFPRTRANCKQILQSGGIDSYLPEIIVRKTEGRMTDDHFWLRFHE